MDLNKLIQDFDERMGDTAPQPRFNVVYKVQHFDDGMALDIALLDHDDVIDCQRWFVPGNITTQKALDRWANARMKDFKEEIVKCL